jgi:hypothetical protein
MPPQLFMIFQASQQASLPLSLFLLSEAMQLAFKGDIPVQATAMNTDLKYASPANQSVITETIVEFLQLDSTLPHMIIGGKTAVSGKYNINCKLCFPNNAALNASLVQ